MIDRHEMIITHVSLVSHGSYETYETNVRNVMYADLGASALATGLPQARQQGS